MSNQSNQQIQVKRGDVFYADLSGRKGSEQGGIRPVLVVQNDVGNRFSPTLIVIPITSQLSKTKIPTHVNLNGENFGMAKESVILAEQLTTIDRVRLRERVTHLGPVVMGEVDCALLISIGLVEVPSMKKVAND